MSEHAEFLAKLSETELLARCIWGEARGESVRGKLAVAYVVLNRAKKGGWFGDSIRAVILKPWQFSAFNESDPNLDELVKLPPSSPSLIVCRTVAAMAMENHLTNDPTGGATHYHAEHCTPEWRDKLSFLGRIGNHMFYREG